MSLRAKLLQGGTWAANGFVIATIIQMVVNIVLVRILPPPILGDYYLLINIISFLVILGTMGMSQTILKLVPACITNSNYDLAKQYLYKSINISVLFSLSVAAVFFIIFPKLYPLFFYSSFSAEWMVLVLAWFFVMVLQYLLSSMLRALHDLKSVVLLSDILPKILLLIGLYFIWENNAHSMLPNILVLLASVSFISVIILFLKLQSYFRTKSKSNNESDEQSILTLAFPLWATSIMLYLLTSGDIWIIGFFLSTSDVAIYASVLKLTILLSLVFNLLITVITPAISELFHKQDLKKLELLLRGTTAISGIPALIMALIFFVYGEFILGFIFGEFYETGSFVLKILSIGIVVNILTGPCGTVLMYTNNQKLMMNITIVSGIFTIVGSLYLVKLYGIAGVAVASSLGMIMQNVLMFSSVRYRLGIWTHFSITHLKEIGIFSGKRNVSV